MSLKRFIFLLGLILLLLVGGVVYKIGRSEDDKGASEITSGRTFTEEVNNGNDKSNLIRVSSPQLNQEIISPLVITGEARGTWYFEASFPVVLTDWDGLTIAEGHAQAEGEWMTEEFVPFKATLTFKAPAYKNYGTLILRKDNPSGLSEHDDTLEIPVLFRDTPKEPPEEVTD